MCGADTARVTGGPEAESSAARSGQEAVQVHRLQGLRHRLSADVMRFPAQMMVRMQAWSAWHQAGELIRSRARPCAGGADAGRQRDDRRQLHIHG